MSVMNQVAMHMSYFGVLYSIIFACFSIIVSKKLNNHIVAILNYISKITYLYVFFCSKTNGETDYQIS